MRPLYKIFDKLLSTNTHFCLQSHGKTEYYNLAITDSKKKQHTFSADNIDDVEKFALGIYPLMPTMPLPPKVTHV